MSDYMDLCLIVFLFKSGALESDLGSRAASAMRFKTNYLTSWNRIYLTCDI